MHIRPEGVLAYRRVDTAPYLARAVEHLRCLKPRPDVVLATGDPRRGARSPDRHLHASSAVRDGDRAHGQLRPRPRPRVRRDRAPPPPDRAYRVWPSAPPDPGARGRDTREYRTEHRAPGRA